MLILSSRYITLILTDAGKGILANHQVQIIKLQLLIQSQV